ncbi:MAG: patatin-like phospholipase family protein [Gammaproteobacteria bacterium]|nr:patatin-like phospholipase family protein [Gammaproteobacteria bacterium]MBU0787398.1 patatin-like phospholipase family protein [Gammaproteobacteria bacterium]MBU0816483.1 patatin-like phospholipase family protein [Gammaproteobacteria bacterium]MBU1787677.1 patatin-like phospholipase family protein [Gammaproteobacteria bacterium]
MSLDTIIHSGLSHPTGPVTALVLMGGGARTAYQVGVLRALAAMLKQQPGTSQAFPFQVLLGTSAGALNASYLAGCAPSGLHAFEQLASFWGDIRSTDVYRLNTSRWAGANKLIAAWSLSRQARAHGAILDSMPLVDTLHRCISLPGIEHALNDKTLSALAVTASSYTSGVHWTFCHTAQDAPFRGWSRPGRRAEFQPITIEHLMASSAIPFLFPATPLWVDKQREYFGDGSMRQASPLSPAMKLGAQKVLVVGVSQPGRSTFVGISGNTSGEPSLGSIAGHTMASVFHDTLEADVEQTQRVTQTLKSLPSEIAAALPYRSVEVLAIQPSQSLDNLAHNFTKELPRVVRSALGGLGLLRGSGALASYLLFEPGFVQSLIALGESDAYARKDALLAFFRQGNELPVR